MRASFTSIANNGMSMKIIQTEFVRRLLRALGFGVLLLAPALAKALPEGTIGWWYYAGGGATNNYAADPATACSQSAANHMGTWLIRITPRQEPSTTPMFDCWYPHFLNVGGSSNYVYTFLQCESGYYAVWPGVCVKRYTAPRPIDCANPAAPTRGNPVLLATGMKFDNKTDYADATGSLVVSRHYRGLGGTARSAAGAGWRFSFDRRLTRSTWSDVALEVGTFYQFYDGNNYAPPSDERRVAFRQVNWTPYEFEFQGIDDRIDRFTHNGTVYALTSSKFRGGYTQVFTNNAAGRPVSITDSFGKILNIEWTGDNVTAIRSSDTLLRYEYRRARVGAFDIPGMEVLIRVTTSRLDGSAASSIQYHYEDPVNQMLLTGITDERGVRYASYAYNGNAQVVMSEHAGGAGRLDFSYPSDGSTIVTDLKGARTYTFDTWGSTFFNTGVSQPGGAGCDPSASTMRYDYLDNPTTKIDFNNGLTCYTFDQSRKLEITRVEGLTGPACSGTVVPGVTRTTSTVWHPTFKLPTQIAEPQRVTTNTYDALGNLLVKVIQATQDLSGALGVAATPVGEPRIWRYTYNNNGQVTSIDGPRVDVSDIETFEYDTSGSLLASTNALGHRSQVISTSARGLPTSVRDANGLVTNMTYDLHGRLTSQVAGTESFTFGYDAAGSIIAVAANSGRSISMTYDDARRLTQVTDEQGNRMAFTLDATGNRTREDIFDSSGQLAQSISRVMDPLNRMSQMVGGRFNATHYGYDANGNMSTIVDPLGNRTTNAYDGLNRLVSSMDAMNASTFHAYDGQNRNTRVQAAHGAVTRYTYDGLGNRTREESADRGATNYTHDAAGNVVSMTDARGVTVFYAYDAANRLVSKSYLAAAGVPNTAPTQFVYDQGAFGVGRLSRIVDASGATDFAYDAHGRTAYKVHTAPSSVGLATAYTFDAAGQVTSMTYPTGHRVQYQWWQGRVIGLSVDGTQVLSQVAYHPSGVPQSWQWGNGAAHARAFDLDGNMVNQSLDGGARSITFDLAGRIAQLGHSADARYAQNLTYDNVARLTGFQSTTAAENYAYDGVGNRVSKASPTGTATYSYAGASNRLLQVTGSAPRSYGYDAAGNTLSDGVASNLYDAASRRVSTTVQGQGTVNHVYNGLGQRVEKKFAAAGKKRRAAYSVRFAYNNDGRMIGEYDYGANVTVQETVWLGDIPVAVIKNAQIYYVHADHLNTPRVIKRATNNQTVWRWAGDPFGASAAEEDVDGDGVVFAYNLRFAGQYVDRETGLHQNWFRDYETGVGRYVQSDPIGLAGGINTYAYVDGNPVSSNDPEGLKGNYRVPNNYNTPRYNVPQRYPEPRRAPSSNAGCVTCSGAGNGGGNSAPTAYRNLLDDWLSMADGVSAATGAGEAFGHPSVPSAVELLMNPQVNNFRSGQRRGPVYPRGVSMGQGCRLVCPSFQPNSCTKDGGCEVKCGTFLN